MRKIIICAVVLLIFCCPLSALAESATIVGGGEFSIGYVKSSTVSVNIKDNPGLMGYKIFVEYPADVVKVNTINRGTVTKQGNFSNNFDNEGKIIVVWNHTSEVKMDGSLFDILFEVVSSEKNAEIKLSYSKADTFNEQYQVVLLNTQNILLKGAVHEDISKDEPTKEVSNSANPEITESQDELPLDKTAVLKALNEVMKNYDLNNLSEQESKKLLTEAAQAVNNTAGTTDQTFSSLEGLEFFYNQLKIDAAAEQIEKEYGSDIIADTVSKVLKGMGIESVEDLDEKAKKEFSEAVKEQLKTEDNTLLELDDDEVIEAITSVLPEEAESKTASQSKKKAIPFAMWVIIGILLIAGIGCLGYIIIKKKQGSKTK